MHPCDSVYKEMLDLQNLEKRWWKGEPFESPGINTSGIDLDETRKQMTKVFKEGLAHKCYRIVEARFISPDYRASRVHFEFKKRFNQGQKENPFAGIQLTPPPTSSVNDALKSEEAAKTNQRNPQDPPTMSYKGGDAR